MKYINLTPNGKRRVVEKDPICLHEIAWGVLAGSHFSNALY